MFICTSRSKLRSPQLFSAIDDLRRQSSGNFTHTENLHPTLVFIGESDRVSETKEALLAVSASPFDLTVVESIKEIAKNAGTRLTHGWRRIFAN